MYTKTVIGDVSFFSSKFVQELGIYIGDPPPRKPKIPRGYCLVADMSFEMHIHYHVPLTQDVSLDNDYKECYKRFETGQQMLFPTTVELYLVKLSDVEACAVEELDPNFKWPFDYL